MTNTTKRKPWHEYQTIIQRNTGDFRSYYELVFRKHLTLQQAKELREIIEDYLDSR